MLRNIASSILIISTAVAHAIAQDGSYKGLHFATPTGWTSGEQNGQFLLAPTDMTQETAVVIVLYGAEGLGGKSFEAWLRARMASGISPQVKVLQDSAVQSNSSGSLQTLSTGRTIQDASGGVRLQVYHAISDGKQAAAAMLLTASQTALTKYSPGIQALFASMSFSAAQPAPDPTEMPAPAAQPSAGPAAGKGEPLPKSEVVGGKPQGLFAGVSVLSGNPVFLLFLPGGRVYHGAPRGGMSRIDWGALEAANRALCGRWSVAGSNLKIQWNDGNVWDGPLELTPTGIKFQNKRYGRVVPVAAKEMAGSWEGARSTAWLNLGSGPSTTQVNNIAVDAAGNFAFASATGSSVAGASAYGESRLHGRLTIEGYDAVFRQADGTTLRMSLARFPDGADLILLDGTAFTRR
jgi:hypothetical protein